MVSCRVQHNRARKGGVNHGGGGGGSGDAAPYIMLLGCFEPYGNLEGSLPARSQRPPSDRLCSNDRGSISSFGLGFWGLGL